MTSPAEGRTDAQLLDLIRAGDEAALDELRRRHRPDVQRTARTVAHDQDEADQIAEDTFESLLGALAAGQGPHEAVSPYLRTMVRRHGLDSHRTPTEEYEAVDPAAVDDLPRVSDPLSDVETRNLVREAYESLPERWQRVLWFTEIEGRPPAALVPDLSSAASAVAALAYRAREGLRQAYLAVHMSLAVAAECQPVVPKLPAYIREALAPEDDVTVAIHLDTCADCRHRRYELLLLVSSLRSVLAPALLGCRVGNPAATRPVAVPAAAASAGAVGHSLRSPALALVAAFRGLPQRVIKVAATAAVAVLAAAALAWAASSALAPPTTSADEASGTDRNASPEVMFEESAEVDEPPLAATMNPTDVLDGVLAGLPDDTAEDAEKAADATSQQTGGSATDSAETSSSNEPRSDNNAAAGDSGSGPAGSGTSDSAGDGAAAGAPGGQPAGGGAGNGGSGDPPPGPDPGPGEAPDPPSGDDDGTSDPEAPSDPADDPDEEDEDDQGLLEQVLCLLLC